MKIQLAPIAGLLIISVAFSVTSAQQPIALPRPPRSESAPEPQSSKPQSPQPQPTEPAASESQSSATPAAEQSSAAQPSQNNEPQQSKLEKPAHSQRKPVAGKSADGTQLQPADPTKPKAAAATGAPTPSAARVEPRPAPPFSLTDSGGRQHSLQQYDGHTIVLEWIHPECPYVTRLYRSRTMQELAQRYAPHRVTWLAINSSHFATAAQMEAWRKKNNVPYPILLDTAGTVGQSYGASRTPHMFVIHEGRVVYSGALDDAPLGQNPDPKNYVALALDDVLAGRPVSHPSTSPYGCFVKYAAATRPTVAKSRSRSE